MSNRFEGIRLALKRGMATKHAFPTYKASWLLIALSLIFSAATSAAAAGSGSDYSQGPAAQGPYAGPRTYKIAEFHDPVTKAPIEVVMEPGSLEAIKRYAPKQLAQKHAAFLKANCKGGAAEFFFHEFPSESIVFNKALADIAATKLNSDPGALLHWYKQSVKDPFAHVSFMAFMLSNRAMMAALKLAGIAYDPCNFGQFKAGPTRVQKLFGPIIGPIGMTAGMFASNIVNEIRADRNLQLCATSLVTKIDEKDVQLLKAVKDACEQSYEDWAVSRKIMQWAPDVMAMVGTSLFQGYVVNRALMKIGQSVVYKRSTSVVRLVIQGLRLGWLAGTTFSGPVVSFVAKVGNIVFFLGLTELVTPPIKAVWEPWRQGRLITEGINQLKAEIDRTEKNQWVWAPAPKPEICQYEPDAMEIANGYMTPSSCFEEDPTPARRIKSLGDKQRKWRQFLLEPATTAQINWQSYVIQFTNTYTAAYQIYEDLLKNINEYRTTGRNPGAPTNPLYSSDVTVGLKLMQLPGVPANQEYTDEQARQALQGTFIEALNVAQSLLKERDSGAVRARRDEIAWLRQIIEGLEAGVNSNVPLADTTAMVNMLKVSGRNLDENELKRLESEIRKSKIAKAFNLVNNLTSDPKSPYFDLNIPLESPSYHEVATRNPFARLRWILGQTKPMAEGLAYLQSIEDSPRMVNRESKDEHPAAIGRAGTPRMVDYILASMVCGPEADPSVEVKIKVYNQHRGGLFDKIFDFFGLPTVNLIGRQPTNAQLIEVERYFADKELEAKPSLFAYKSQFNMVAMLFASHAAFRPPRIINNLGIDFCTTPPRGTTVDRSYFDIHQATWKIDGGEYKGFLDLVKKQSRSELVDVAPDQFNPTFLKWWSSHVDVQVKKVIDIFREDYLKIVRKVMIPAMTSVDANVYNGERLSLGVAASVLDDARYHILLARRIMGPDRFPTEKRETVDTTIKTIMDRFRLAVNLAGSTSDMQWAVYEIETGKSYKAWRAEAQKALALGKKLPPPDFSNLEDNAPVSLRKAGYDRLRQAFKTNEKALTESVGQLKAINMIVIESDPGLSAEAKKSQAEMLNAVYANLEALVTETGEYYATLNSIRIDGLE